MLTCPVRMEVTFVIARAKNHWSTAKGENQLPLSAPEHCTVGGDIDKLARGLSTQFVQDVGAMFLKMIDKSSSCC